MLCFKKIQSLKSLQYKNSGFTITELLVTIFIITLVTGIILLKYTSFNTGVLLKSQAYELALDIREAQIYSVSVRSDVVSFDEEYGLFFDVDSPNEYLFFQDSAGGPSLAVYNEGEEVGDPLTFDNRYRINSMYTELDPAADDYIKELSVSFKRPNFDARMYAVMLDGSSNDAISTAYIEISPLDGSGSVLVSVSSNGQISIE